MDKVSVNDGNAAPVCIVGMHRSGTSLVARLLNACGLFLGREEELIGPATDNPEGFWENLNFVGINEELLSRFGGSWDEPPALPPRWEFGTEVEPLLGRAAELVARFGNQSHWGWKDPRNSLTIPFWLRVIPSLKIVVCVRNPLEVAHSLFVRGNTTSAAQFRLWLHYYRQVLSAVPPSARVVTHYQAYFEDVDAEVRRVSGLLGLEVSSEAAERARAQVSGSLRHHHVTTDALRDAGASDEVVELYLRLCDEAGPVCRRLLERESADETSGAARRDASDVYALQLMRMDNKLTRSEERLRALEERYAGLEAQLHEVRAALLPVMRLLDALRALRARLLAPLRRGKS
ncbi:MAG TPA: sulfotransferase [Pyrinomonadaceae bacterium]